MSIKDFITKTGYGITNKLGSCNDSQIATAALASFKLFFIPFATMSDKKATKEQKEYAATRDFLTELIALTTYIGITGVAQRFGTAPLSIGYYKNKAKLMKEGKIPFINPQNFSDDDFKALENIDKKPFEAVMLDNCFRPKGKGKATTAEKQYVENLTNIIKKFEAAFPKVEEPKKFFAKMKYDFTNLVDPKAMMLLPDNLCKNVKLNISQMCIWTLAVFVIPPMCNLLLKPVLAKFKEIQSTKNANFTEPAKSDAYPSQHVQMNEVKKPVSFNGYYNVGNIGNMRVGM